MAVKMMVAGLALALFMAPAAVAEEPVDPEAAPAAEEQPAEKKEQPAEEAPAFGAEETPEAVVEFLADKRPSGELESDELRKRIATASGLLKNRAVPEKLRNRVAGMRKRDTLVLRAREAEAKKEPPPPPEKTAEEEAPPEKVAEEAPPEKIAEEAPANPEPKAEAVEIPEDLAAALADTRPAEDLSDGELRQRLKSVRPHLNNRKVAVAQRQKAMKLFRAAQAENQRRAAKAAEAEPQAEEPAAEAPEENAAAKYLADSRDLQELSDEELDQRAKTAGKLLRAKSLPEEQRAAVTIALKAARQEFLRRREAKQPPKAEEKPEETAETPPPKEEAKPEETAETPPPKEEPPKSDAALDANEADPAAEAKAQEFLADTRKVEEMKDEEARQRLDAIRDLLAENALSAGTERSLRRKLRADRDTFRSRLAEDQDAAREKEEKAVAEKEPEAAPADPALAQEKPKKRRDKKSKFNLDIKIILGDRRPSRDLEQDELQQRIEAYREAVADEQYEAEEREAWREKLDFDRRALRERRIAGRRERAERYQRGDIGDDEDIGIEDEYSAGAKTERKEIFAAEAGDEEIERQLKAPPRRPLKRKITVEEIGTAPDLREAMPAIDIDTIRFGFNESFVREEEIENLDRIGGVIEKILARRPKEIFLIEGHTDAVGSDAYNIALSRKRAAAVKDALSTYYVIPAKNLKIAGYGERYLKIPTSEAEEENRRVGLRRVTPLIGELDEQ